MMNTMDLLNAIAKQNAKDMGVNSQSFTIGQLQVWLSHVLDGTLSPQEMKAHIAEKL